MLSDCEVTNNVTIPCGIAIVIKKSRDCLNISLNLTGYANAALMLMSSSQREVHKYYEVNSATAFHLFRVSEEFEPGC